MKRETLCDAVVILDRLERHEIELSILEKTNHGDGMIEVWFAPAPGKEAIDVLIPSAVIREALELQVREARAEIAALGINLDD